MYDTTPAASISENLNITQDAAHVILGGTWRMPTEDEFTELLNSLYTEFVDADGNVISGTDKRTTYNGVVGLLIRSKANGNTLFLPAAGFYVGSSMNGKGSDGRYWSSSYYNAANAYRLRFYTEVVDSHGSNNRYYGFSVRAVLPGTPNRSIVPPTPDNDEETPTVEEPKDKDER